MASQPDILFIILDTQRRDRLSMYGHSVDTSPRLAEFSTGSTVFERAVAPAQWTIPAHGSLFTGLYPSMHQVTQAFQQLSGAHPTLADILRVEGYHTVAFCNNPFLGLLSHDLQRGFDAFYNYAGASPHRPIDETRSAARRRFARWFRRFAQRVTNRFAHSDFLFRASLNPLLVPLWSRFVNFKGDGERSIDDLIAYWEDYHAGGQEKPLFTFLNLMGTHTPYRPPANYLDQVAPNLRHNKHVARYMARFNANAAQWLSPSAPEMEDWQHHALSSFYDAEIAHQDVHVGRLLNFLKKSGALDNTMVIIAADHGEGHGDHGFHGHSFVVYQELVHVPLLIHYPERFPAGKHVQTNVSTRRLFHTILDVTGTTPPLAMDDPNADVQGLSLISSLNGRPDTERGVAFSEAFPPLNLLTTLEVRQPEVVRQLQLKQIRRGVYDGDHKLALVGKDVESLFDVASDPSEDQNVAEENPAIVTALQEKMDQFVTGSRSQRLEMAEQGTMSDEVLENLRALGYFE